jgi:hypothetical protein
VQKIADPVKALPEREFDEFLTWLADHGVGDQDAWDRQVAADGQPGGRLEKLVDRARSDIAAGRTAPLDEVLDDL